MIHIHLYVHVGTPSKDDAPNTVDPISSHSEGRTEDRH